MQTKQKKESESFWPRFKHRIKHDRKSKTYSVQISPTDGKSKALVRILSVSSKGDVIPVTIVSPIDKPADIISVMSQKSDDKEELIKPAQGSWVRVVVRKFGFSKSRNGKVRQVPGAEKPTMLKAPKIRTAQKSSSPKDSTLGPVEQQLSEATDSKPPVSERAKGVNFHSKIKAHASAPCSPRKSTRATAQPASASHTHLPPSRLSDESSQPQDITFDIHRSAVAYKSTSKSAVPYGGGSKTVVNLELTEGYDATIAASVLIVVLLCLVLSDKLVTVVCTCLWWYAVAVIKKMARFNEAPTSKPIRGEKQTSHSNIDLQSSEYKKKVIMEGLLQRNGNTKR